MRKALWPSFLKQDFVRHGVRVGFLVVDKSKAVGNQAKKRFPAILSFILFFSILFQNFGALVPNAMALTFSNGMAANSTIGSPTLSNPMQIAIDSTHHYYYATDSSHHRVLVYELNTDNTFPDNTPDFAIGQADLSGTSSGNGADQLNEPRGLAVDPAGNRLFVADYGNNRVLVYDLSALATGMSASHVLGQSGYGPGNTSPNGGSALATQTGINGGINLAYDGSTATKFLYVAENGNDRVSIFDVTAVSDGEAAVNEVGQCDSNNADLSVCDANYTKGADVDSPYGVNDSPNRTGFYLARNQTIDYSRHILYVVDSGNNRVLGYDLNGSDILVDHVADYVLGQPDFNANKFATSASGMFLPFGIAYDADDEYLFVSEAYNHRISVYDASAITSTGNAAIKIIGQPDFVTADENGPSQTNFSRPIGIAYDSVNKWLYATDQYVHNRVLIFDIGNGLATFDEPAIKVLGQTSYTNNSGSFGNATTFGSPTDVAYDAVNDRLFVSDGSPNRVVVFDAISAAAEFAEPADHILGQADFAANVNNYSPVTAHGMAGGSGLAFDPANQRLFVADSAHGRAMVFNVTPGFSDNEDAEYFIGQEDGVSSLGGSLPTDALAYPDTAFFDDANNRLYLGENSGVKVFATPISANGPSALDIIGQTDGDNIGSVDPIFGKSGYNDGPNRRGFYNPAGIAVDAVNHRIFVSDPGYTNSRVMVFNLNASNVLVDRVADAVLGPNSFNKYVGDETSNQALYGGPQGLAYDPASDYLFVTDTNSGRVLIFDADPGTMTEFGQVASYVIGHSDFDYTSTGDPLSSLNGPTNVYYDQGLDDLFISDSGNNRIMLFGDETFGNPEPPPAPPSYCAAPGLVQVSGGNSQSYARKSDGTVWAWGSNSSGQLGDGTNNDSTVPVQVDSGGMGTDITTVVSGGGHALALKSDGTVWAWGFNNFGQLGDGTNGDSNVPVQVSGLTGVTQIAAGYNHSMALKSDGTVWAWGFNNVGGTGQLGNGSNADSNVPVQVDNTNLASSVTEFFTSSGTSIALKSDGTVWTWGFNNLGQLGNGTNSDSNVPVQVDNTDLASSVTSVSMTNNGGMALKSDGTIWTWGYQGTVGYLGNNDVPNDSNVPVQVFNTYLGTSIADIAGGYLHALVVRNDGTVWSWGYNGYGQLGTGDYNDSAYPTTVAFTCPVAGNPTLQNRVVLSREKVSVTADATVFFTLQNTLSGVLTVTFPAGFTVTSDPTVGESSGCLSSFGHTAQTAYATKTNCSSAIYLGGFTVTNPATPGSYLVHWVNDDEGEAAVPITLDDQINVTATVNPFITFQVVASGTVCDHGDDGNSVDHAPTGDGGTVAFGVLTPTTVASSENAGGINHVCTFISTNAPSGYSLTVKSQNGGLTNGTQYINSEATEVPGTATGTQTLSPGTEGYGLCLSTTTAPNMDATLPVGSNLSGTSPFAPGTCDDTSATVGKLATSTQNVGSNSGPVQEGTAQWNLKSTISATTGAGAYSDILTWIATGTF